MPYEECSECFRKIKCALEYPRMQPPGDLDNCPLVQAWREQWQYEEDLRDQTRDYFRRLEESALYEEERRREDEQR